MGRLTAKELKLPVKAYDPTIIIGKSGINGSAVALAGANSMSGVRERLKIRRLDKERMRNLAGVSLAGIIPFINVFWGSVATRANAQTSQMDVS
jgi:hypothetical protein